MSLDWLIIGGGIHGVHIAARLIGEAKVDPTTIRVVDPGERLLDRWLTCTATTGMTHLRSPAVHNIDVRPLSLLQYAGKRRSRKPGLFMGRYKRPRLTLFNDHCEKVITDYGLDALHVRARVVSCTVGPDRVVATLSSGEEVTAANTVLALGGGEQPVWPSWAPRDHPRVSHVFASDFSGWPVSTESVIVVGAGISAVQVALRLVEEGHNVHMVSRHGLREHRFDSDSGWLGPKLMTRFEFERDVDRRREMISEARHKGSIPPDVRRSLNHAIRTGRAHWHVGEVERLDAKGDAVSLRITSGVEVLSQRVLLATGFTAQRPGGRMVDELIASAALPCASCGYPVVDRSLRWHPRVYVSGPLAELELGPTARNISGARRAADRVVTAAQAMLTQQSA